jgi:1-aminocyclopropane-1-carboxylate deaminase/D-cysteine desulfhydrase-like pyridoxal-dependent ACC family enzyme
MTGLALGGNKGRKLEYLLAEAVAHKAQVVVSCGSTQSNFIRQLGAVCSMFGIRCAACVMDLPYEVAFGKAMRIQLKEHGAIALADRILGVEVHRMPDGPWEVLFDAAEDLALLYEREGLRVFRIPIGGSSPLGAYGFFKASMEVEPGFDFIVTASSSGSTHAGLAYGFAGTESHVIGISCDPEPDLFNTLVQLCQGLDEITGCKKSLLKEDFDLRFDWVGEGYGVTTPEALDAIGLLAREEGIFLDPIYSGKAFAGLVSMVESGRLSGKVLFWHTGGWPTLFALPEDAVSRASSR